MERKIKMKRIFAFLLTLLLAFLTACTAAAPAATSPAASAPSVPASATVSVSPSVATQSAGPQEITFMIPPWGEPSADALKKFTQDTGIKVNLNIVGWDEVRDKIAIAAVGQTAPADVCEVDWSWVGEFSAAGWFDVLDILDADKQDMPTLSSFTVGGKVIAVPYGNDFRIGYYNTEHFGKAGISTAPTNWDELLADAQKLKSTSASKYPICLTLSASETCTTSLIWLTLARSGNFFNEDGTFNKDNFLSTLQFVNKMYKEDKVIDPAMATMKDTEVIQYFLDGKGSFIVGPTNTAVIMNDATQSSVVQKCKAMLIPGRAGVASVSMALPEGIGIPAYSKNKEAARKFLDWYISPDNQLVQNVTQGCLPTRNSVLKTMMDQGKLPEGETVLAQAAVIKPAFPAGTPSWYPEMSATIYNTVNEMITSNKTPEDAIKVIDAKIAELLAK
jgi:multiple sugar transport system substrate-binding protein